MKKKILLPAAVLLLLCIALTGVLTACNKGENTGVFASGVIPVQDEYGYWGYADSNGEIVIPCEYNYATAFNGEYAAAGRGSASYVIDSSGKQVAGPFGSVVLFGNDAIVSDLGADGYYIYTLSSGERSEIFDRYEYLPEPEAVRIETDASGGIVAEYRSVEGGAVQPADENASFFVQGSTQYIFEFGSMAVAGATNYAEPGECSVYNLETSTVANYAGVTDITPMPSADAAVCAAVTSSDAEGNTRVDFILPDGTCINGVYDVSLTASAPGVTLARVAYNDAEKADGYFLFNDKAVLWQGEDISALNAPLLGSCYYTDEEGAFTFYTEYGAFTHTPEQIDGATVSFSSCTLAGEGAIAVSYAVIPAEGDISYRNVLLRLNEQGFAEVSDVSAFAEKKLSVVYVTEEWNLIVRNNLSDRYGVTDISGDTVVDIVYTGVRPLGGDFYAVKMGNAESVYKVGSGELMPFIFTAVCPEEAL